MVSREATGPMAMVCSPPWIGCIAILASRVWRRALPDHEQGQHEAEGKHNTRCKSHQIAIEIAEIGATILDRERPNESHRYDTAGGGRGEHRKGDRRHLAEIRQRRLPAIALPIGVGDEADGGVECQNWLHPREFQRVQRQIVLEDEDQID